jgi:hypothetical protein
MVLDVAVDGPMTLSLHSYYVPNWTVYADGQKQETYPLGKLGLLAFDVPGGEHQVSVHFQDTPVELGATLVSLACLAGVLAILVCDRRWKALFPLLAICALLASATAWHVRSSPSIQRPAPVDANLANQVKLLGYHVDRSVYRPGETVQITLYWLALQEMSENYKVFVHLTDEGVTQLIAQSDRWPVYNFSPTTRWQSGEIVWDRHEIKIPPDETPGAYRLTTGMYLLETMQNLAVLSADGNPPGDSVPLSTIEVKP